MPTELARICGLPLTRSRMFWRSISKGVTHLSSGAARAFLTALRAARPQGTHVIVTHADAQCRATFYRLGLTGALDIYEDAAPDTS
jgi:anti-anti-sigma regulatory factor